MLDKCPSEKEIISLVGKPLYNIWLSLTESIDAKYEMERLWNSGGKMWKYEYKYRRGGKNAVRSLCKRKLYRFYGGIRARGEG